MSHLRKNSAAYLLLLLSVLAVLTVSSRISNVVDYKNTAHIFMLTTLQQWEKEGILHYHASPVQTFSSPGDKFNAYYDRLLDTEGNNYYISHPPGVFVFNYAISQIIGITPVQSFLQVISLLWLIGGAWFLYGIALRLMGRQTEYASFAALLAAALYLFHPVNLYAYSFHNFAETFGQFLFLLSVWAWLRFENHKNRFNKILFAISLAAFAYTDWLAIPLAMVLLWLKRKEFFRKKELGFLIIVSLSVGGSMVLAAVQYISISGIQPFIRALGIRYLERSGFFGALYTDMGYDVTNPESYELLWRQLMALFSGSGLIALILMFSSFFLRKKKKYFPAVLLFPSLIFAAGLFSATITHYIYIAKFTPFIACSAAMVLQQHMQKISSYSVRVTVNVLLMAGFIFTGVFTYKHYQQQMPYETVTQKHLDIQAAKFAKASPGARCHYVLGKNEEPRFIIYLSYAANRNIRVLRNELQKDSVLTLPGTYVSE